jgi:hypothetical protein
MDVTAIVVATAPLFASGLFSNRLERADCLCAATGTATCGCWQSLYR